jgi:hypothetical protein
MSWSYRAMGQGSHIGPDVEAKLGNPQPPPLTARIDSTTHVGPRPGGSEEQIKQKIKEIIQLAAASSDLGFVIDAHGAESVSAGKIASISVSLKIDTVRFAGE